MNLQSFIWSSDCPFRMSSSWVWGCSMTVVPVRRIGCHETSECPPSKIHLWTLWKLFAAAGNSRSMAVGFNVCDIRAPGLLAEAERTGASVGFSERNNTLHFFTGRNFSNWVVKEEASCRASYRAFVMPLGCWRLWTHCDAWKKL